MWNTRLIGVNNFQLWTQAVLRCRWPTDRGRFGPAQTLVKAFSRFLVQSPQSLPKASSRLSQNLEQKRNLVADTE